MPYIERLGVRHCCTAYFPYESTSFIYVQGQINFENKQTKMFFFKTRYRGPNQPKTDNMAQTCHKYYEGGRRLGEAPVNCNNMSLCVDDERYFFKGISKASKTMLLISPQ